MIHYFQPIVQQELDAAGIQTSPDWIEKNISRYAFEKLLDNDFEEVYTEYRTKKLWKEAANEDYISREVK